MDTLLLLVLVLKLIVWRPRTPTGDAMDVSSFSSWCSQADGTTAPQGLDMASVARSKLLLDADRDSAIPPRQLLSAPPKASCGECC